MTIGCSGRPSDMLLSRSRAASWLAASASASKPSSLQIRVPDFIVCSSGIVAPSGATWGSSSSSSATRGAMAADSDDCRLRPGGAAPLREDWRLMAGMPLKDDCRLTAGDVPCRECSAHTADASSALSPVSPRFFSRARQTCPRLGSPHCWQRFLDSMPFIRSLRPFSILCHRFRTDETLRPGSACTILLHLGPSSSSSSMMV
mmetsp:Transcript_29237/g.80048  ORF Transcript_29237/g.80048 Transcript_29237/m.80048 type:complete len:203 (-) Transcript_29237:120-728(-)